MPHVSGERTAAARPAASSRTPALTNANSGSTTNDTYGPTSVCSRSLIEIVWRRRRVAVRAYAEFGDCRNARITSTASSTCLRSGANTGISSATATPASVGWMPAMNNATHSANPRTAYAGPRSTGMNRTSASAMSSSPATANGITAMASE